jgi:type II secretory pathway component GspD/PulD (secretin)
MRIALCQAVAGVLAISALASAAHAQAPARPYLRPSVSSRYSPPTSRVVVGAGGLTSVRIQSSVTVPDGGSVSLGGYSQFSEGRSELGTPGLGRTPYLSRGFRNVGYGRSTVGSRVRVGARIISLREEEYRQTGFRSP